jgi:hypothetical protein
MKKERNENRNSLPKPDWPFADHSEELKQLKKQAEEDLDRIRPILEKDPDWPLASGQISWEDKENYYRKRNAVSRLTRKAVCELFPEYKVHVRRDRGTASGWIGGNFVIPGIEGSDRRNIIRRTNSMLLSVGIEYASFFPDSGPGDDWTPCLLVTVNHYC